MSSRKPNVEYLLEAGIIVSSAIVLGAFGALWLGRAMGVVLRSRRERTEHPKRGSIPATRHEQIAVSSPR